MPGERCTGADPYTGFDGAFRCLVEAGDIAFLRHTTVDEMLQSKSFSSMSGENFELLCLDGRRSPLSEYRSCSWGKVTSHAVVTSSARTSEERRQYQRFLTKLVELYSTKRPNSGNYTRNDDDSYGRNYDRNNVNRFDTTNRDRFGNQNRDQTYLTGRNWEDQNRYEFGNGDSREENQQNDTKYENFELFESGRYGKKVDLLFSDSTQSLALIKEDDQAHTTYLGDSLHVSQILFVSSPKLILLL